MSAPYVRLARDADRPACALIYRNARQAAFHWEQRDYLLEDFASSTYGETLWVAEGSDAKILAFASVWKAPDYWFLHNLFVAPASQRRGVGRTLLRQVLASIGRPVDLKTDLPNLAARRFYEAAGFRIVEEGGDGPVTWVKLRLE